MEGKACSSSAAILVEMYALENVYRSSVAVEHVQFSFSVLNIKMQVPIQSNLAEFLLAWQKPAELLSGLS